MQVIIKIILMIIIISREMRRYSRRRRSENISRRRSCLTENKRVSHGSLTCRACVIIVLHIDLLSGAGDGRGGGGGGRITRNDCKYNETGNNHPGNHLYTASMYCIYIQIVSTYIAVRLAIRNDAVKLFLTTAAYSDYLIFA